MKKILFIALIIVILPISKSMCKEVSNKTDQTTIQSSKNLTLTAETDLSEMYTTIKHLHQAAIELTNETSLTAYDTYDLATSAMVMQPALGGPSSSPYINRVKPNRNFTNVLPARPRWVKLSLEDLNKYYNILSEEFSSISFIEFKDNPKLSAYMAQLNVFSDTMQSINKSILLIDKMVKDNNFDNEIIYKQAELIKDNAIGLNDIRKNLIKEIKKYKLK